MNKLMQLIKCRTLWFVLFLVGEQVVISYCHRRSAKHLGEGMQNHETRKDAISLSKRIAREIFRSQIFGFDSPVKLKK